MSEIIRASKIATLAAIVGLGASACGNKESTLSAARPINSPMITETTPFTHAESCAAEIRVTPDCGGPLDPYTLYINDGYHPEAQVTNYGQDRTVRFKSVKQLLRFCNGNTLAQVDTLVGNNQYKPLKQEEKGTLNTSVCDDTAKSLREITQELSLGLAKH